MALAFAVVLAATSNDSSHRLLGRGWKFVQRQTYTLFVLTWLHTAGWLEWPRVYFGGPPNRWFWTFTVLAVVAQFVGFVHTVRASRGPSPRRASPRTRHPNSTVAAAKWVAVAVLWGGLIFGSFSLGTISEAEAASEEEVAPFCTRYEQVKDLSRAEMFGELIDHAPELIIDPLTRASEFRGTAEDHSLINEFIGECQSR